MLCALIMAGGKGTRFWPLSTEENPKQFLNLIGKESMIQMTVSRLTELIPMERIFVVTDQKYEQLVNEHLPALPSENVIIEPIGMNTAPCIALSAMLIENKFPNSTLAVLPSDHLIEDEELFRKTLDAANLFVETNPNAIVTLGMSVTRPEVGYGYIKYQQKVESIYELDIHQVERFVEKPDVETATQYMNEGNYLWNGGMFIWKGQNVINLTKNYLPNTFAILQEIVQSKQEIFKQVLFEKYPLVDSISVDYGIMEKANEICVIPSNFGWDDIGSWLSLERYRETDEHDNILDGKVKALNSKGNIIVTKTKPMVLCGVENLILVETDDVVMVMKKDDVGKINELRSSIT
ncbi:MAG: mannose-1-phosphate guanylyltransferase [Turicibacter sanguinis]|uniref:mannose-1-phosphate guanylyltransferase n=1 Tax=Turicibacter sanguinis TaxID=154288 RepID=UPI003993FB2A